MKTLLTIMIALIILVGGYYYLWLMQKAEEPAQEEKGAVLQADVVLPQPEKYIPPGAVMEDGTI